MSQKCMEKKMDYHVYLDKLGYKLVRQTNNYVLAMNPRGDRVPLTITLDWPMLIIARTGRRIIAFTPPASQGLLPDEGPVCIIDRTLRSIKGHGYAYKIKGTQNYEVEISGGKASRWDHADFLLATGVEPPIKILAEKLKQLKPSILILARVFTTVSPEYSITILASRLPSIMVTPCINGKPIASISRPILCADAKGKPPRIIEKGGNVTGHIPHVSIGL